MPQLQLHFREYGQGDKVLVILHGVLGASQNWQRVAKVLGENYRVLVVDQRNHGSSPHTPAHTIDDLREDLFAFFEQHGLEQAFVLGHSMGGIAAMEFAFHYPERLRGLMIEDIAPRAYRSTSVDIIAALAQLDLRRLTARQQAEEELRSTIPNAVVRQFVLTNLVRSASGEWQWRMNISALATYQHELAHYEAPRHARYTGETLFLGGARSEFHIDQHHDLILQHFPNSHLEMIPNAGHWLHFEVWEVFVAHVRNFLEHGLRGLVHS
ncbi:alpha/beta fold hydrolase [candidate division KSB1 bacterium]|nr:alpha/beta fold hydrolase [candidate division KSB1 bacterium]